MPLSSLLTGRGELGHGAKDAPLGDSHKGSGDTHMAEGLNMGKAGSAMGKGKAPNIKSNMKLDGKMAGGSGMKITAGKKGGK